MATRSISIFGLRAVMFANRKRLGVELSTPLPGRGRMTTPVAPAPAMPATDLSHDPIAAALAEQVSAIAWYHTIDLGHGVVTPGFYDHRPILDHYRLPDRLDGLRVLDIAGYDGFWAFEFERRGAAEVVTIDIATARELDLPFRGLAQMSEQQLDRPFGAGFRLAHKTLSSRVRHEHCSIYDLTPERFGRFDVVHCGDLLLHLRDPALALRRIQQVTRGFAIISDCIFPDLDRDADLPLMCYVGGRGENVWWRFSANALKQAIADAGFDAVEELSRFRYGPRGAPTTLWHAVFRAVP